VRFRRHLRPRSLMPPRALAAFTVISMFKPYGGKMSRGQNQPVARYYCPKEGCKQEGRPVKIRSGAPTTCPACGTAMVKKKRIV